MLDELSTDSRPCFALLAMPHHGQSALVLGLRRADFFELPPRSSNALNPTSSSTGLSPAYAPTSFPLASAHPVAPSSVARTASQGSLR